MGQKFLIIEMYFIYLLNLNHSTMKKIFTTYALLMFVLALNAQITFEKSYDFYNSASSDLVFSQDDGYLMAMISLKDKYYLTFVKTDLNGDTLWTKNYDRGVTYQMVLAGTQDEQGNIYIASDFTNENLLKLDKNCNILWAKKYTTEKTEMIVKDNNLWVCGNDFNANYLFRIDATTGDSLWRSPVFGEHYIYIDTYCSSIAVTESNEVIVTVSMKDAYYVWYPSQFFKLSPGGTELVEFNLHTNQDIFISDTKSLGNELISIASNRMNDVTFYTYFIKYTSDGTILTFKELKFDLWMRLMKAIINQDQVVTTGFYIDENYNERVIMNCYSLSGDSIWTTYNGLPGGVAADFKLTTDGGYIITGAIGNVYTRYEPFLIKTNSMGVLNGKPEKTNTPQVVAYPNPASDAVMFTVPGLNEGVLSIYNSTGQLCFKTLMNSEKTMWNINGCKSGLYLYRVKTASETFSGSVVVK